MIISGSGSNLANTQTVSVSGKKTYKRSEVSQVLKGKLILIICSFHLFKKYPPKQDCTPH
jgi:hypothetical protein